MKFVVQTPCHSSNNIDFALIYAIVVLSIATKIPSVFFREN